MKRRVIILLLVIILSLTIMRPMREGLKISDEDDQKNEIIENGIKNTGVKKETKQQKFVKIKDNMDYAETLDELRNQTKLLDSSQTPILQE